MSAADKQKMDDSGPQNWVVPEVMKPEEKELVEKLTQVMSKNTFHRAKEATRLARSSDAARNELCGNQPVCQVHPTILH